MEIIKTVNENATDIALVGRLDTTTAPDLEKELKELFEQGVSQLTMDFEQLDYISSAGLRVLLFAQKSLSENGKMTIRNVKPEIMEVFDITGFIDILTIE
ncbi:MAG: STAS domain-containing protein [Erysipelotrichaceae bacterium]|nr:STAS domain-containing protein [Erysipelotrichaceae bacterium]MBQ1534043.1 STAS domain-containing protein [Erysipelotrichaceae bacterium]MBQ1788087.1 STAS domain-containing protein [Erysipelotrichaceae bacterium]MBQ5805044.1 STAS domain-containing protein [Erysipelotrichaceae bacterium]MBQ6125733.1 STAS domain-containing protein [Erysipelotrichaceae bacterium]